MIEADAHLVKILTPAEPDVFTRGDALDRIDALAHRVWRERGQIPTAISEGIVLEVDDWVCRLRHPGFTQLATLLLLLRLVVPRQSRADDGHDDIRLQLVDLQRRQRVDAVGAGEHLAVGMRLADLLRHAIDEAPDMVRGDTAPLTLGRVFACTQRALADGRVSIGRHHRDHAHLIVIELGADIAHRFLEQFFVRVAQLVDLPFVEAAFATVHREPLGMRGEDLVPPRHGIKPVGILNVVRIAHAQPHKPHGRVATVYPAVIVEAALSKIGSHSFVQFLQRDRFQIRQHFAQFTRQIPTRAEAVQKSIHRVKRAALIMVPHLQRHRLLGCLSRRPTGFARQGKAALIHQNVGRTPKRAGDFLPLTLSLAADDFGIALRPWFNGRELRVIADERQPVRTRNHAKRALLKALRRDFEPLRVLALPYEHMHRSRSRLCDDRQSRAADFLNPILQLLRRQSSGALRLVTDDNFSTRLAVFDEEVVSSVNGAYGYR